MDIAVITHCGSSSLKNTMTFPEVVSKLREVGVIPFPKNKFVNLI